MNVSLRSIVAVALSVAAVPAFAAVFEEDAVPGRSPQEQIQAQADARLLGPDAAVAHVVASTTGRPTAFGLDERLFPLEADPGASPTDATASAEAPAIDAVVASTTGSPTAIGLDARVFPNNADPGASPTEATPEAPASGRVSAVGTAAAGVESVSQACTCTGTTNG